jgi:hypothetical protein
VGLSQVGLPLRWDPDGLAGLFAGEPLWRVGSRPGDLPAIVDVLTAELARAAGAAREARPWSEDEEGAIPHLAATSYAPVLPLFSPP